jgi:hypothetical protein
MAFDTVSSQPITDAFRKALRTYLGKEGEARIFGWPVYVISNASLAQGQLQDARAVGYQCFTSDAGALAAGDVTGQVATVIQGKLLENLLAAVEKFRALKLRGRQFEWFALRAPGISVEALWAKPKDGGTDLFIPYVTNKTGPELGKQYKRDEFLAIVQKLARKVRQVGVSSV